MFDLDKAIQAWKRNLVREKSLEDSYVSELEAALRDEVADLVKQGVGEEEAFRRSTAGMGEARKIGTEFAKVRHRRRFGDRLRRRIMPDLFWNYVRVSLRKIRRQKGYSVINIAGLAVGLACCVLMLLWVGDERSFDRFHDGRDSIYRLFTERVTDNSVLLDARSPTPIGPVLKENIPEVVGFTRYQGLERYGIRLGDQVAYDDIVAMADPGFFDIFTFPLLSGNPKTALDMPDSVVVTERAARKYFGTDNPMGKTLFLPSGRYPFKVTGVMRDIPRNSHIQFSVVIPAVKAALYHHVNFNAWQSMFFYNYIRLAPGADPAAVERKIARLLSGQAAAAKAAIRLQPLGDVHLKSDFAFDLDNYAQGSASTLTTFSIAAAAVLLLACINFMNLATARSAGRAKEVGLRKVVGGRRSDLIRQFLGESIVLAFVSLVLAVALVGAVLPLFNRLAGKQLALGRLFAAGPLAAAVGVTLLTGLLAGSYPALFLSAFRPAAALKDAGLSGGRRSAVLRKGLVVVQFALTVFLVIGTIVVDKQLAYIRNKSLGIDTHNVLTLQVPLESGLREALLANPAVLGVSISTPPGQEVRDNTTVAWEGKNPETIVPFLPLEVDEDYLEMFRLAMAEGRFFDKNRPGDQSAVVVNETAARAMGPGSPLGKRVRYSVMSNQGVIQNPDLIVIGVMKDFHQASLRRAIEPMLFVNQDSFLTNIRIRPSGVPQTLAFLEKTFKEAFRGRPLDYTFIDDKVDGFYAAERRIRDILGMFTILALFTACLGLSGLASFLVERRTKEIGIRKVLGAAVPGLILAQTREFALWVLAANVVAWPAIYYAAGVWLRGFAYRISPGIGPAAIAAAFSLAVSLLAVGAKAVRASRANPVDSLKYE